MAKESNEPLFTNRDGKPNSILCFVFLKTYVLSKTGNEISTKAAGQRIRNKLGIGVNCLRRSHATGWKTY